MPPTLLNVKFYIPKPKPFLTERQYLLDRFTSGLTRPVTLISAPAGFGKSTLLSAWLNRQTISGDPTAQRDVFCWLTLDSADNQGSRFWTYFVAAIQTVLNNRQLELGVSSGLNLNQLLEYLQSDPPPSIPPVLDELINAISGSIEQVLLILDDYYLIQASEIHEQMTYLLEHQPPNLHLVISTRADPPLPITRLRARGLLNEFRVADLRFNAKEVEEFFKTMTGLTMVGEEINAIQASTEGWIAGLQMAALALQALISEDSVIDEQAKQSKIKDFIFAFSGKHLYILDYLTDEVFNHQSAEVQIFLLKTSILERMSIGLCEAILRNGEESNATTQTTEGANNTKAKIILDYLEKSNLFLVRLDYERQWFRYHHLFSDLLRARLEQSWSEIIPDLHRKASHWYEQNGFVDDAIQHAMTAKDWEWAAVLMETHVTEYLELGQLATVLKWIELLPNAILSNRPILCSQVAWALTQAGQFQRVPPLIDIIESALTAAGTNLIEKESLFPTQQDQIRVQGIFAVLRAFGSFLTGKPEQALMLVKNALETKSGFEPRELTWLNWMCGYAYRGMGQLDQAIHSYEIALSISHKSNTDWVDMSTDLGIAYRLSGKLTKAVEVFQNALLQAENQGIRNKGNLSRVEAFFSAVLFDQNRLEEAYQHALKGIHYLQWWPSHNHITTVYVYLSQILIAMDRLEEAAEAIQHAEQEQHKGQVMPIVLRLVENTSLRLWVKQGSWDLLERWLSAQETELPDYRFDTSLFNEYEELHWMSLVRAWIAKGKKDAATVWLEQAFQLLVQIEFRARRSNWVHALVEIYLLKAIIMHELVKTEGRGTENAMEYLTTSLGLGLPAGFLRVYLQEGPVVTEMLQNWLKSSRAVSNHAELKPIMVKNLLDLLEQGNPAETRRPNRKLIEPLTGREQEVLQLLTLGLSNKEMAERMVISEGTIKTHVHNLIGKLGAQSRIHVLTRARELDLL